jgi:hypothetical protein
MISLLLLSAASIIGAASYIVCGFDVELLKGITPSMTYFFLDRKSSTHPLGADRSAITENIVPTLSSHPRSLFKAAIVLLRFEGLQLQHWRAGSTSTSMRRSGRATLLQLLHPKCRAAVELRFTHGLSYREIALHLARYEVAFNSHDAFNQFAAAHQSHSSRDREASPPGVLVYTRRWESARSATRKLA